MKVGPNTTVMQRLWGALLPANETNPRARKLVALLLIVGAVCVLSVVTQLLQGMRFASLGTASVLATCVVGLVAHRRGVSRTLIATILLAEGMVVCALLALAAGREGLSSLQWMAVAPLIGLATGGRRTGWITLAAAALISLVTLVLMDRQVLPPAMEVHEARPLGQRITTIWLACLTIFLVVRAYEIETERAIEALEAKNLKLLAAREESERANSAKNQFLATISHELRTPLNGLVGMATALSDERRPERLDEGLRVIRTSADTLLAVINDVLDFSKIDAGKLTLESIPLSVAAEVTSVVELMRTSAAQRGNTLTLTTGSDVPEWMLGDPTRVRQIALNLVGNAIKFTERGAVRCTLSMDGERMRLDVGDTGVGMSAETLARIGAPFVQADASTTRRHGGTGLGLVITRRLISAMGGELRIVSAPGTGSTFSVLLPAMSCEAPAPRANEARRVSKLAVLVVDDNTVNRLVAQRLLQKLGHQVTLADHGAEALALVARTQFDLILMDCHMPVMDGYEATRTLRERGVRTPIFALTAAVTMEDQAACIAAGMNRVLTKPLRIDRLLAALDEVEPTAVAA
ncbi:MAG: response regulator [Archangium sp.]|nr:response regulator [Archangium sp.]